MKLAYCRSFLVFCGLLMICFTGRTQQHLDKLVTLKLEKVKLGRTIDSIGRLINITFSYNSNILTSDSLITFNANRQSVRNVLDKILGDHYEYSQTARHIIILRKNTVALSRGQVVSGYVYDQLTNETIRNASIYDKVQLITAITDKNGYFRLRPGYDNKMMELTISKEFYEDTTILLNNQDYTVPLKIFLNKAYVNQLAPVTVTNKVEQTWLARRVLNYKQIAQSLNVKHFFAKKKFQFSLFPGVGTKGRMGAQVENAFSINLLGGYTAATHGVELAGIFNIVKNDVKGAQLSGVFNLVGGNIQGIQYAGLYNQGLQKMNGIQFAGLYNAQKGKVSGIQLSGGFNVAKDTMDGIQVGPIFNSVGKDMSGVQISNVINRAMGNSAGGQVAIAINYTKQDLNGLQLGIGVNTVRGKMKGAQANVGVNYAKSMDGFQLGLVNISDTSTGFSFGLINLSKNYIGEYSFYASEITPYNIAVRTGNPQLYNIISFGADWTTGKKIYHLGYGLGHKWRLSSGFSVNPEIITSSVYLGSIKKMSSQYQVQMMLKYDVMKHWLLYGGPSYSFWKVGTVPPSTGYRISPTNDGRNRWLGWQFGIGFQK